MTSNSKVMSIGFTLFYKAQLGYVLNQYLSQNNEFRNIEYKMLTCLYMDNLL